MVKSRSKKAIILAFFLSMLSLLLLATSASATITSWSSLDDNTKTKVAEPLWKALRSNGFTAEAAAGIMGNIAQESSFNPLLIGGNVAGGVPCYGLFQWCPGLRDIPVGLVEAVKANDFDKSAEIQIKALVEEVSAGAWLSSYWNPIPTYTSGSLAGFAFRDLVPGAPEFTPETFKKTTDIETATAVMLSLERPCPRRIRDAFYDPDCKTEMGRRLPQSKIVYEALKNVEGSPSDTSSSEEGEDVLLSGGIISEDELVGMPQKRNYLEGPDGDKQAELPGEGTLDPDEEEFTGAQVLSLSTMESAADTVKEERLPSLLRVTVSLLGLFLIFYSVLLITAYAFDRSNTLVQIPLYKVLTLGRRHVPTTLDDTSKGATPMKTAFFYSGAAALLGILLITGGLMQLVLGIYFWGQDWLASN